MRREELELDEQGLPKHVEAPKPYLALLAWGSYLLVSLVLGARVPDDPFVQTILMVQALAGMALSTTTTDLWKRWLTAHRSVWERRDAMRLRVIAAGDEVEKHQRVLIEQLQQAIDAYDRANAANKETFEKHKRLIDVLKHECQGRGEVSDGEE